ncbi:Ubiquitin-related domain [Lasallia pustulata]|uniref:Ubiquitin-related domain n=1 Tax=Lasallia pustulata TaxID=136370 RepID=A0A1W5D9T0_9LECA|nr:Ubiquitin-related domain [Lasallia pustulata]
MTELTFAKSFLSTLDSRPIKLPSDHISDPKTFEPKGPYTLPRMPNPMAKRPRRSSTPSTPTNPGAAPALSISLKSLRNPPIDLRLSEQSPGTSIHDVKVAVAETLGEKGTEKIRILYKKKPCADSKTIGEVVGEEATGEVELAVMVIGWTAPQAPDLTEAAAIGADTVMSEAPVAHGRSGEAVVETEEFWGDLQGWLLQRVRDETATAEALACFKRGWNTRTPR